MTNIKICQIYVKLEVTAIRNLLNYKIESLSNRVEQFRVKEYLLRDKISSTYLENLYPSNWGVTALLFSLQQRINSIMHLNLNLATIIKFWSFYLATILPVCLLQDTVCLFWELSSPIFVSKPTPKIYSIPS